MLEGELIMNGKKGIDMLGQKAGKDLTKRATSK